MFFFDTGGTWPLRNAIPPHHPTLVAQTVWESWHRLDSSSRSILSPSEILGFLNLVLFTTMWPENTQLCPVSISIPDGSKQNNDTYRQWRPIVNFFFKYPSWGIFRQNPAERGVVISQQRRTTDGNFDWMKVLIAPIQKNKVDENGMRKDVASGELFAGSNLQLMVPLATSQVQILRLVWIHIVLREMRR